MAIVYRYTDLDDEQIKYVGIVWSGNRTLKQRDDEHRKNDDWCRNGHWKVEYLKKDVKNRTDAEALESHYVNKFGSDQYYNVRKAGWGISNIIDDSNDEWVTFRSDEETASDLCREYHIDECELIESTDGSMELLLKAGGYNFRLPWVSGCLSDVTLPLKLPNSKGWSETTWILARDSFRSIVMTNIGYSLNDDEDVDLSTESISDTIANKCTVICSFSEISGEIEDIAFRYEESCNLNIGLCVQLEEYNGYSAYVPDACEILIADIDEMDDSLQSLFIQRTNTANFKTFCEDWL